MGLPRKGRLKRKFAAAAASSLILLSSLSGIGSFLPHTRDAGDNPLGDLQTSVQLLQDAITNKIDVTDYLSQEQAQLFKDDQARANLLTSLHGIQDAIDAARNDSTTTAAQQRDLAALDEVLSLVIPVVQDKGIISFTDALANRDIRDKAEGYVASMQSLMDNPGPFAQAIATNPEALDALQNVLPDVIRAFIHDADHITVDVTDYLTEDQSKLFTDDAERGNLLEALHTLQSAIGNSLEKGHMPDDRRATLASVDEVLSIVIPAVETHGRVTLLSLADSLEKLEKVDQYQASLETLIAEPGEFADILRDYPGALSAVDDVLPQILSAFAPDQADMPVDVTQFLSQAQTRLITNEQDRADFLTAARGIREALQTAASDPTATAEQKEKMASVDEMLAVLIPIVEDGGETPLSYLAQHLGSLEKIEQYKDDIQFLLNDPMIIAKNLLTDTETLQAAQRMLPKIVEAFHIHLAAGSIFAPQADAAPATAPAPRLTAQTGTTMVSPKNG